MKCKDCTDYKYIGRTTYKSKIDGSCQNQKVVFPLVSSESECVLTRSKLHCRNCSYWVEAEITERKDDCGGCTYGGSYFPMFLDETCGLKEPYKSQVEKEMLG